MSYVEFSLDKDAGFGYNEGVQGSTEETKEIDMNISERIRQIAGLKGRIAELERRLLSCAIWQNDEQPDFDFNEVYEQYEKAKAEMAESKGILANQNASVMILCSGKTISLAQAIALLQEIKGQIAFLDKVSTNRSKETQQQTEWDSGLGRHVNKTVEIKNHSALSAQEKVDMIEELRSKFAHLNSLVEAANHAN